MKMVLFDIDGTMIRSDGTPRRAMEAALLAVTGVSAALNGVKTAGTSDLKILQMAADKHLGRPLTDAELAEVSTLYLNCLRSMSEEAEQPFRVLPGVLELCEVFDAHREVLLGLQTGNLPEAAQIKLGKVDLWHYFQFGGYGDDGLTRTSFLRCAVSRGLQLAGLAEIQPKDVVVIGDTEHDVLGGKELGAYTVAVATGGYTLEQLQACAPDLLCESLAEVEVLIDRLLA